MRSAADDIDIGKFFAWAARPRETPARSEELHRIVRRYLDEPDFASAVDHVFSGAGLDLRVDGRDGIVVTARHHSLLRLTAGDIIKRAQPSHRSVIGAVLLAVARTAYPEPGMVDDPDRVAVFTTQSVVDMLDRTAQRLADESGSDSDVDDDLVEGWRRWLDLPQARPNARRRSAGDRPGAVNRICKLLVESGYLNARGDTDGGTWTARPAFRHAVAALAEDSDLYALVNDLPEPIGLDPADPA
ncbi:hypothetical protein [Amycolatopsis sp. GA6-003]|uniref:hypothetical protein n=1 Tax=Amycolatopsis sp. GA6-003 TaxID=2652444 RepID=UPI0039171379